MNNALPQSAVSAAFPRIHTWRGSTLRAFYHGDVGILAAVGIDVFSVPNRRTLQFILFFLTKTYASLEAMLSAGVLAEEVDNFLMPLSFAELDAGEEIVHQELNSYLSAFVKFQREKNESKKKPAQDSGGYSQTQS